MSERKKNLSEYRILISNDDGVHAHGLKILEEIALSLTSDVWVVAPETEQSGSSHSLTLHEPLRTRRIDDRHYAVSGTPTDCALLAIKSIMRDHPPDLLLSGVNRGANLGEDVTYSGTIAAAMEGTLLDIPSIALSQACYDDDDPDWNTPLSHAPGLIARLIDTGWPKGTLINLNFPDTAPQDVKGIQCAPQGRRKIGDRLDERIDPKGRPYVWIGSDRENRTDVPGSDINMVSEGYVTITPLNLDLTDYKVMEHIREYIALEPPQET